MYSIIFIGLNPQSDNISAETTIIEQDNEVCYKPDENPGKASSHLKTGIIKKLMVQTNLSYMSCKKVYTCLCYFVCVSGKCIYTNHVETFSKCKCAKCNKTSSVSMPLISTNVTVLQRDIHVEFVKRITLDSLMFINIWKFRGKRNIINITQILHGNCSDSDDNGSAKIDKHGSDDDEKEDGIALEENCKLWDLPCDSCLQSEIPEQANQIFLIAPGEGKNHYHCLLINYLKNWQIQKSFQIEREALQTHREILN